MGSQLIHRSADMPNTDLRTVQEFTLPETGYVRLPQILKVIPIGKSTWWAGVASGRFPASIKLGPRTTVWKVEDIRELLSDIASGGADRG